MIQRYGEQDLIVMFIVFAAAAWLTRRWWLRRKRGSCTCDGCPVAEQGAKAAAPAMPAATELVTIEAPRESR